MADPRTERNALLGATLVKKLQARAFDAYYCATKEEAFKQALALIPLPLRKSGCWSMCGRISNVLTGIPRKHRKSGWRLCGRPCSVIHF